MTRTPPETSGALRPPVALGCFAAVAVVALIVLAFVFFVVFLNSGTEAGNVVLSKADSYGTGTVTYNGSHNFYIVRLPKGDFVILADLDAANRESQGRKCRAAPMANDDPNLLKFLQEYAARMSPQAASTTFLFREACNGAVYDITGARLDAEGPNLDRYPSSINGDGKLVVDVRSRQCTQRKGTDIFAPTTCAP